MTAGHATAERGGLLADIIAHPADDAPRLIYADWLEDNGESERAEFIRSSVRSPQSTWVRPADWLFHVPWNDTRLPDLKLLFNCFIWKRGFVAEVLCTLKQWLEHGKAVCAVQPIERVELTDRGPTLVPVVSLPVGMGYGGDDDTSVWIWFLTDLRIDQSSNEHYYLPPELHGVRPEFGGGRYPRYASEQAAIDALSDELIRWARTTS